MRNVQVHPRIRNILNTIIDLPDEDSALNIGKAIDETIKGTELDVGITAEHIIREGCHGYSRSHQFESDAVVYCIRENLITLLEELHLLEMRK